MDCRLHLCVETAEGWLYVAAIIDLFSRRVVGWSMNAEMTAQLVTDALVMAAISMRRKYAPNIDVTPKMIEAS